MPDPSREFAPAKVNLFLHVVGRRDDGYHLLDSLAVFPDVGDTLSVEPAARLSLSVEGSFAHALAGEADNLVIRAARALAREAGVEPHGRLILHKRLPVASGIGGGSADAAAALRLLCRHWDVTIAPDGLAALALDLGADVTVCLANRPARMGGIGEALSPAPVIPACGMVLINPGVAVSTPAVFRARIGGFSGVATLPREWQGPDAMVRDLAILTNDLQPPAISLQPVIRDVLDALAAHPACLLARMSGSGATCFALFRDADAAVRAAETLRRPGWWVWGGGVRGA